MDAPRFRQSHSTRIGHQRYLWNTERLWELAAFLPVILIDPRTIAELTQDCWYCGRVPTIGSVIEHMRRVESASLDYPIILNANGELMDGGHRIAKAILRDIPLIKAVRFPTMPPPDHVAPIP